MPSHALPADAFEIFQLANAYPGRGGGEKGKGKGEAITGASGASGASASISVIFLSVFCFFPRE